MARLQQKTAGKRKVVDSLKGIYKDLYGTKAKRAAQGNAKFSWHRGNNFKFDFSNEDFKDSV